MPNLVEQIDRLTERLQGGQQTMTVYHLLPIIKEIAERLQKLEYAANNPARIHDPRYGDTILGPGDVVQVRQDDETS